MGVVRVERMLKRCGVPAVLCYVALRLFFYMPISYGSIMHYELVHDLLVRNSSWNV